MRRIGLAGLAVLALPAGAGLASDGACFRRDYSAGHLAAHPEQVVTSLEVVFLRDSYGNDIAHAAAGFRGDPEVYASVLFCSAAGAGDPKGAVSCGVECDGGTFVAWTGEDGALRLRTAGFLVNGGCGAETDDAPTRSVADETPGRDTVFRLPALAPADCLERIGELTQ